MKKEKKDIFSFVKTDYIETERYRKIDYGAIHLRKEYHKFMAKGIGGAIGFVLILFITYITYIWVLGIIEDEKALAAKRRITDVSQLAPPPSMDDKPKPPPPPAAPKAPGIGEVKKVKDEEAPRQKTVATQDLLKMANEKNASEGDDTTGLSTAPIVDIPTSGGNSMEDPADFVAVEKEPEFTVRIRPEYPESARRAGLQGKVFLRVLVGKDGKAEKVQVIKSSGSEMFDQEAIKSLQTSTYTPAVQNGQPVRVWLSVPIVFKLQN